MLQAREKKPGSSMCHEMADSLTPRQGAGGGWQCLKEWLGGTFNLGRPDLSIAVVVMLAFRGPGGHQ